MEEGIVVRLKKDKGFGFIERDGKADLHFRTRYVPDVEEGDKVEFEEFAGPQGPSGRKVKVLERNGAPYAQGQKAGETPGIGVTIKVGDPHTWMVATGRGNKKEPRTGIPVKVIVTNGNQPVRNEEIKLDADGIPVVQGTESVYTDKDGEAFFRPILPADAVTCHLVAHVQGKQYAKLWEKNAEAKAEAPASPAMPQKPSEAPIVQRLNLILGVYTFQVQTTPKTSVALDATVPITARRDEHEPWTKGPFTSDEKGELLLQVRVEETAARGNLFFCVENFRSKPQYVVHPGRPQRKKQE